MSRFEQSRARGTKRSAELPSSSVPDFSHVSATPASQIASTDPLTALLGNNINYVTFVGIGISMALSIYLYRETRKMKSDLSDIAKSVNENEQLTNNTKSIEGIEEQISHTNADHAVGQIKCGPMIIAPKDIQEISHSHQFVDLTLSTPHIANDGSKPVVNITDGSTHHKSPTKQDLEIGART